MPGQPLGGLGRRIGSLRTAGADKTYPRRCVPAPVPRAASPPRARQIATAVAPRPKPVPSPTPRRSRRARTDAAADRPPGEERSRRGRGFPHQTPEREHRAGVADQQEQANASSSARPEGQPEDRCRSSEGSTGKAIANASPHPTRERRRAGGGGTRSAPRGTSQRSASPAAGWTRRSRRSEQRAERPERPRR